MGRSGGKEKTALPGGSEKLEVSFFSFNLVSLFKFYISGISYWLVHQRPPSEKLPPTSAMRQLSLGLVCSLSSTSQHLMC